MNLKELRNEKGNLFGVIIPKEDIAELKNSLKADSELFTLLALLLDMEKEAEEHNQKLPNGLSVEQTYVKTSLTTENLYKNAFSKGIAMYYQDERAKPPREFVRANPDGSEDLVSFDITTRTYFLIKKLVPAGEGRWAYLL